MAVSLWTWARVGREHRILGSRRRSRHLRCVHEECRRGRSRVGVSPVQVVDMQRVQVGALTAAAYAQSRRRRSCPVSLQNCGTMRLAVAGGGGGKAAKAASVLETQTETQAEKVWQARLKAGECLVCCGHWHGLGVAGARTGSASAGGAGTGASGSKSGSGSGSNGGSGSLPCACACAHTRDLSRKKPPSTSRNSSPASTGRPHLDLGQAHDATCYTWTWACSGL